MLPRAVTAELKLLDQGAQARKGTKSRTRSQDPAGSSAPGLALVVLQSRHKLRGEMRPGMG